MKMTAREMFKSLGYERSKYYDRNQIIEYNNEEEGQIVFWVKEQEFSASEYGEPKSITVDEFKAIHQQLKELGWLDEKTCTNVSEFDSIDEFECSNCGIVLSEYQQIEIDEDDGERFFYDYRPKYCPNCGRKIIEENEDE